MVALGFSRDRAGPDLADIEKKKRLKKWIKSITDLSTKNQDEESSSDTDSSDHSSDTSSNVVSYKFPYDIFIASEITDIL